MMTCAPAPASPRTIAVPAMPAPPLTSAILPSRRNNDEVACVIQSSRTRFAAPTHSFHPKGPPSSFRYPVYQAMSGPWSSKYAWPAREESKAGGAPGEIAAEDLGQLGVTSALTD